MKIRLDFKIWLELNFNILKLPIEFHIYIEILFKYIRTPVCSNGSHDIKRSFFL